MHTITIMYVAAMSKAQIYPQTICLLMRLRRFLIQIHRECLRDRFWLTNSRTFNHEIIKFPPLRHLIDFSEQVFAKIAANTPLCCTVSGGDNITRTPYPFWSSTISRLSIFSIAPSVFFTALISDTINVIVDTCN